jgi:hypothetical protein
MRKIMLSMIALGSLACRGDTVTNVQCCELRLPPPTVTVRATSRPILNADSLAELEVSAVVSNRTSVHLNVAVGVQCPLGVRIFPDPTGAQMSEVSESMACPSGGPTVDLGPSDSLTLTHVVHADSLSLFAPGAYGLSVVLRSSTAIIGVWAGAVQLPLGRP